jgi:hypothetical protein
MLMLAAAVLIVWSYSIDSREGMEAFVIVIMWGMAAGSFLVGLLLRTIGVSQTRKKALADESVVKTRDDRLQ